MNHSRNHTTAYLKKALLGLRNSVFFWIFIFGFVISLFVFLGKIDQDFFAFYYIGRGITEGLNLYRDIAENKGPVLYWFFAFLFKIFKANYSGALFFSNWLLDTVSIFLITKLLSKWIKYDFTPRTFRKVLLLLFIVLYYKSFSIGMVMAGTYSENIALLLLVVSLLFYENKKNLISGIFFGLAVFCRQTVFFFSLFYLYRLIAEKKANKDLSFPKYF